MQEGAEFSVLEEGGRTTVVLHGPLLISTIGALDEQLREFPGPVQQVDLSGIGAIDTVGAWCIHRFASAQEALIIGAGAQAQTLLEVVRETESGADIVPVREHPIREAIEDVGIWVHEFGKGAVRMTAFLGAILVSMGGIFMHPSRFRLRATVRQMELVGVNSLGIIGLMSFLIGIVIAQQGAVQLEQFGAEALTVNLVGRITLRELGVLMTAIMVAGRSGSAFAAQIGTMKLTEEVDAMRTIGVSPMEALIIPRILASVLMMPLLGFYASVVAIMGGAVISHLTLDLSFFTFLSRIREVVPTYDLYVGLTKAPVFGLIVALTGCYQGMQVQGNAEQVGLKTTASVVQAIFLVIVLDAFFAVFFTEIGWG